MASPTKNKPHGLPHRKERKARKGNNTPGRTKGWNCHAGPDDKTYAKCSRSYKLNGYGFWPKQGSKLPNVRA